MKEDLKSFLKRKQSKENACGKLKTCKCGIKHGGYYGDKCAVCVVLERVGGYHANFLIRASRLKDRASPK